MKVCQEMEEQVVDALNTLTEEARGRLMDIEKKKLKVIYYVFFNFRNLLTIMD